MIVVMLPINVLIAAAVAAHSALLELVVESLVISLSASVTGPITLVSVSYTHLTLPTKRIV